MELAAALLKTRTLTALDLAHARDVGIGGVARIVQAAAKAAGKIKLLNVSFIRLGAGNGSSGMRTSIVPQTDAEVEDIASLGAALAALIERNELRELHLESTHLPEAAALQLFDAMHSGTKLTLLNLSNNSLPAACSAQLAKALQEKDVKLHTLLFDCNSPLLHEDADLTVEGAEFAWIPSVLDVSRWVSKRGDSFEKQLDYLGNAIGKSRLSELSLSGVSLPTTQLIRLLDPPMTRKISTNALNSLNLSHCGIGNDG